MSFFVDTAWPLISVIIPCYNSGVYLPEALISIWQQDYPAIEVVVVDDGSTDNTRQIAQDNPAIIYIYQDNQGPSVARNLGVVHSTGQYIVFLDADDWLLPNALKINAQYLRQIPALAFVSGGYDNVFVTEDIVTQITQEIAGNHYIHLLLDNYIGMIATVMWQRWVFDILAFDPKLRGCEDYDLYLRVARNYPVAHHTYRLAAYRHHTTNKTNDVPFMLSTALLVLKRQRPHLRNGAEREAYSQGQNNWKRYYATTLYYQMKTRARPTTWNELVVMLMYLPPVFLRSLPQTMIKKIIKRYAPDSGLRLLHKAGLYKAYVPAIGQVNVGDFGQGKPFSTEFGYDRGGPIDRYYIEKFLQKESENIHGRVLEIGDNEYTLRFGQGKVQSDILHVNASNPRATFIGDLTFAPHIPDNLFDCIILTQTLHLIYNYKEALATCYRILKPGGVLLITVPGLTPIDHGEWKETWYWSFTDAALQRLLPESFPVGSFTVESFGNVFIASAFLYGMGISEVTPEQLDFYDSQFQVINTVKAIKPISGD